ncbi:MAG: M43 family zinc metalloprotease, partial [Chitinophagaceae bacterium]
MKNHLLILTALCLLVVETTFSQAICAFDNLHSKLMKEDAVYRKNILDNEAKIKEFIRNRPVSPLGTLRESGVTALPYTIPVVVHVVHTGGAIGTIYNPTDAQITGAINYLNQVYNGTYPGTEGVGDLGVQFVLASRDPNCNASTGIDRIDGSSLTNYVSDGVNSSASGGVSDLALKNFDRWDPAYFYNIWVVNKIDTKDGTSGQFVAGYAYFAGASASRDGTVMLATQMIAGQKTLPHEIGHALSLYHPFEGSTDVSVCPSNTTCSSDGDQICDTDPISDNVSAGVFSFTCRTGVNTCTSTPYSINTEHNYMAYTNCYTLFTAGQKARMQAAMSLPGRVSLANSMATGPYPASPYTAPGAACVPVTSASGIIANMNFAGITNVSLTNKSFSSGGSADDGGYVNNTTKCLSLIQLQKSNTYTFSVNLTFSNREQLRIWIDYNNDGLFNNATEQIYYNADILTSNVTGNFTVPATAVTNST